ncbi:MAG: proprotein convertase P-domain-containing protein, partial [Thermoanaerobaculia bacterium]
MKKYFLFFWFLFFAVLSFSFKEKQKKSNLDELAYIDKYLRVVETVEDFRNISGQSFASSKGILNFLQENGSPWYVLVDLRRGVPDLIDGGAIPFIPGPANNLDFYDFEASCNSIQCISKEKVEELARNFLRKYPELFPVKQEEIQIDPDGTIPIGESIYLIRFQWFYNDIPVEKGSIYFIINNGNLIQISSKNIAPIDLDTNPTISKRDAFIILQQYLGKEGLTEKDILLNDGSLLIIPVTKEGFDPNVYSGPIGNMASFKLVYRFIFKRENVQGTWEGLIDAHSGQILRFVDINMYGKIQGGVYKTDKNPTQTEVIMPFPYADYGPGLYSDIGGNFPGTSGTSTMTGRTGSAGNVGSVDIVDNCGSISLASNAQGLIDFGSSGGTDCTTPGFGGAGNTHSARTQYYNVAWIKIKAYTYLSGNTWLQGVLTDNVNINDTCNAYWNGSINFFRSGGGCGNTGELPGVSLHEWGHGMDDNDGSGGDSPPVETRADWTAILQTHQSCAGGGFFVSLNQGCGQVPPPGTGYNCGGYGDCCLNCSGIRDADYAQHLKNTPWTAQNNAACGGTVWSSCGAGWYNGPCGWEDHCESGISTQALWDMAIRDLPTYCGMDTTSAWQLIDRLFYSSMPQMGNMYTCSSCTTSGCTGNTLYNLFRAIDDDGDGTANGTPHAQGIYRALARHNIACGNASDPANQNQASCPTLNAPTLTGTAGSNSAILNWTSVTNATRYFVFRNDTSCSSGFTKIATVNAPTTTYTDATATNGITSYYRVQAATNNDSCVSAMSNCVEVTPQPCAGSVTLDKNIFNCADTGTITVLDSTAPSSPFTVEIWSTTDPTHRTVQVTGAPSTYTGTFTTTTGTPGTNQVKVSHGGTIYIRYTDPDYCGTPNVQVETTASVDCQGPIISNVQAINVTGNSATITWDTDENANSRVDYGTSIPPGLNQQNLTSFVTAHSLLLTGLNECTQYYYSVTSSDTLQNTTIDNNGGNYYTFITGVNTNPTYTSTDVPKNIPDLTTITSIINVTDNKIIQDVNVTIGNITHTYDGDLDIFLIAPDNTRVELSTDNGSSGDNYINTVFDDEASTSITTGTAPFTGSFRPEATLSVLDGKNAQGTWKLEISDDASGDTGILNSWSMTFTYPPQSCGPSLEYQSSTFTDTCNGTGSGNNNGIIDAGEDILLQITLHNNGTAGTTGIYATISTSTPGITITDNYATFPNISAGGTGTSISNHFSFRVGTSVSCGTQINFTININSNEGSWTDTFSLTVGQWTGGTPINLWSESFDGTTFPPAGWSQIDVSGTSGNWARATGTVHPSGGGTHSGAGLAYFNSYNATSGNSTRLYRTSGTTIPSGSSSASLVLWMYHDTGYTSNDRIQIQVSLNGTTWTNVGAEIPRYDGTTGWKQHTVNLSSYIGQSIYIGILGISGYGNDCHIDDVSLTYTPAAVCQMNSCTPSASAPPPVNHTGTKAAKFTKGYGNTINVTYDNTTCNANH